MNTRKDALKKIRSSIEYYTRFCNLHCHPFRVLLDWEFIVKSVGPKYRLPFVFSNILGKRTVAITTKCILSYLKQRKDDFEEAYHTACGLEILDCEHDSENPSSPIDCIKHCISSSKGVFCVGTQDFNTTAYCTSSGDVPIFHITFGQIVMEHPSAAAKNSVMQKEEQSKTTWISSNDQSFLKSENKRLHQQQMFSADPKKRARRQQLKAIKAKKIEKIRKKRNRPESKKLGSKSPSLDPVNIPATQPHKRVRKTKRTRKPPKKIIIDSAISKVPPLETLSTGSVVPSSSVS